MNIFALSLDVDECARWHVDKHIVKMPLETTQLLSNAYYAVGKDGVYRKTHFNHPASKWARESIENWNWLAKLGIALCKEYTHRYNRIHACEAKIIEMMNDPPDLKSGEFKSYKTPSLQKLYYITEKRHLGTWKNREQPSWWI